MQCVACHAERDPSDALPGRKCRSCVNAANRTRYHGKQKQPIKTARRASRQKTLERRRPAASNLSIAERAYVAGLIDGEGCISILQRGRGGGNAFRQGQYTVLVYLTNTSEPMVNFIRDRWGGYAQHVVASPERNRREQWRLQLQANRALALLDDIYEFLVVKRPQAKLARRFQRYVQISGRKRSEKVERVQGRFWMEVRRLNHRGFRPFIEPDIKTA